MRFVMNSLAGYFGNVPNQLRKIKLVVWLVTIAITVGLILNMGKLKFDATIEGWFDKDDPTLVAFDDYHAQFGGEDGLYIVYKPKDGDVFSTKSLQVVQGICNELLNYKDKLKEGETSALDHIVKVNSLTTNNVLTVEGDMLLSKPLVGENIPTSKEGLEKIREAAKNQENFPLLYFSDDMKYGGIWVETNFGAIPWDEDELAIEDVEMEEFSMEENSNVEDDKPRFKPTDMADYAKLNNAVKEIINKSEYADHLEYYPVGNTAAVEYDTKIMEEMGMLYLAAIGIMIILLWFLFRSPSAVLWALIIVALSTIWTIGITALLGFTVTAFLMLTLFLVLTVGMADAVHIMSGYLLCRNEGKDHKTAVETSFRKAGIACLLTSVTTIVGLLALTFSDIVPVKIFAFMSAAGVAIAFILTIYLLPVMLELWSPVSKSEKKANKKPGFVGNLSANLVKFIQSKLEAIVPAVEKRPVAFIVPFIVVFILCIYGSFQVKVDTDLLSQYPDDSKFVENVSVVDNFMSGAYRMVVYLDLGKDNALHDPMVLNAIEDLQNKFKTKYGKYVVTTSSIANVVKDSYRKLNEGDEDKYIIPQNEKELSQTLFLFNNANPSDRKRLVDDYYRKANISISLHNAGSYEYNKVFEDMQTDIHNVVDKIKQKYPDAKVSITGIFALMMKVSDYLTVASLKTFATALVVITMILLLVFGSLRAGVISIIPNLSPPILVFGLLGLFGIPLDFNTMMLAPIIIGITVDDTIHFLSHYRHLVQVDGDIKSALIHTLKESGQGIVFTSLILGLGFGIMSVASASGTHNMGKFGAIAIFSGLINDLFLLPALILVFKLRFKKK